MSQVLNSTAWGLSLTEVFSKCLLGFEQFHTSQDQDQQLKRLMFRLQIEKCRFYLLGGTLGLIPSQTASVNIEGPPMKHVCAVMKTITSLLTQDDWLFGRYGCKQMLTLPSHYQGATIEVDCLSSAFNGFKAYQDESRARYHHLRMRWTIADRSQFEDFLSDITNAIDGLHHIVKLLSPSLSLTDLMNKHIDSISDMETLRLISEACFGIYPDIWRTSLRKIQASAMESAYRWRIEHWHQIDNQAQINDHQSQSAEFSTQGCLPEDRVVRWPPEDGASVLETDTGRVEDFNAGRDNGIDNRRVAEPILIPLDVTADSSEALMRPAEYQNLEEVNDSLTGVDYPMGVVLEDSEDEDTKYASSDESETVMEGETRSRSDNTPKRDTERSHGNSRSRTNVYESANAETSVTNGFINFDVMSNADRIQASDYFVLSFALRQQGILQQATTHHDHSHLVNVQHIARIVRTDSYEVFDLKSWPRELHMSKLVNATSVDQVWMHAIRESKFQANVFLIPTLKLPFCSSIDGCLRTLFDTLAEQRLFARCMPTLSMINFLAPEIFIVPIGKEAFVPRFVSHVYPAFQPTHDVLLVLMVFTRQLGSEKTPNVGLWDIRRSLTK